MIDLMSCHTLFSEVLKNMENLRDLAHQLQLPYYYLTYILYKKGTENCYYTFNIPKKDGSLRTIHAPSSDLGLIQKRLSIFLYKEQEMIWEKSELKPNISHGFEKKKTIMTNAHVHRNKRYLLNLDLKDFFNSFHFGRVRGYFHKNKHFNYNIQLATSIARLTCFEGVLPQGASTSPIITNLICQVLDYSLLKVAKEFRLDYTRYADDLSFSTNDKNFLQRFDHFMMRISAEIQRAGFTINENKTRLMYRDSKQVVTGLVVNKKINVEREYFRDTKAMAHSLYTNGFYYIDKKNRYKKNSDDRDFEEPFFATVDLAPLEGRFSFIDLVDKHNKLNSDHFNLNSHGTEFQRFLFYINFWCRVKPLIITEGKTDTVLLKAALKNLYKDYPELIRKNSDGSFEFMVDFLKTNSNAKQLSKLKRFFGISTYGAPSLENVYNYYFGGKTKFRCPSYARIFCSYGTTPTFPVFLLFDNEICNTKKPIYNFSGYRNLTDDDRNKFQSTYIAHLYKTVKDANNRIIKIPSNLYLLTTPLVNNKTECEIEDLFDQVVLDVTIDGKSFKRDCSTDNTDYYSKEVFSKYISENYLMINFNNFKRILDNISNTLKEYNKLHHE